MKTKLMTIAIAGLLLVGCSSTLTSSAEPYPLDVCIVSDNKLDSMGKPYRIIHRGREIKFCCKPCTKKFNRNPGKYLGKIRPQEGV
tara:strand:- start:372 stop:629 length:258 start_codon:yes stop_codon:yes gene_type:complete